MNSLHEVLTRLREDYFSDANGVKTYANKAVNVSVRMWIFRTNSINRSPLVGVQNMLRLTKEIMES